MCSVENIRPVGQAAKTSPSQGENMGSIPVRVTNVTGIRTLLFLNSTQFGLVIKRTGE